MNISEIREKHRSTKWNAEEAKRRADAALEQMNVERAALEQAAREAADAEKAAASAVKQAEKELDARVGSIERQFEQAMGLPVENTVDHDSRVDARVFLHGHADAVVAWSRLAGFASLSTLHELGRRAVVLLVQVGDDLGTDHPLVGRVDAVECRCWSELVRRLRILAGETV